MNDSAVVSLPLMTGFRYFSPLTIVEGISLQIVFGMKDEAGMVSVTESNNCFTKFEGKRGRVGSNFSDNAYACSYITYNNQ